LWRGRGERLPVLGKGGERYAEAKEKRKRREAALKRRGFFFALERGGDDE